MGSETWAFHSYLVLEASISSLEKEEGSSFWDKHMALFSERITLSNVSFPDSYGITCPMEGIFLK